jgi:hypothetical protein
LSLVVMVETSFFFGSGLFRRYFVKDFLPPICENGHFSSCGCKYHGTVCGLWWLLLLVTTNNHCLMGCSCHYENGGINDMHPRMMAEKDDEARYHSGLKMGQLLHDGKRKEQGGRI